MIAGVAVVTLVAGVPTFSATDEPAVHFTAAGDFSSSTAARSVLAGMRQPGTNLSLALGDLSYAPTGTEQTWCDLVTSSVGSGYPFELVAGNHESNGQNGNINDFSACLPNQLPGAVGTYGRQYYVDVPAAAPLVRYILISPGIEFPDGAWSYDAGTTHHAWTTAAIDSARAAGIPWVVVGMHKPCLSVGEYACDPGADIMNLLVEKRVDLVLTGHEHQYARTRQLATSPGCLRLVPGTFTPACIADPDDTMVKGAGTVFATVGTGGVALRPVNTDDAELPYFATTSGSDRDPAHGYLDVGLTADRLEARFTPVDSATFGDSFTLARGNLAPSAAFTSSVQDLRVSLDGSGSSDPDGTVASYSWDFGDGATGSGAVVTHDYASGGAYTVALTVVDAEGASSTTSTTLGVQEPSGDPEPFATDAFERNLTGQWGAADLGGGWTMSSAANFSVSGGTGYIRMPSAGAAPNAHLAATSSTDTDMRVVVGQDKPPTGTGTTIRVQPRRTGNGDGYFSAVRFVPNASVVVTLVRLVGSQTKLASITAPGLAHQPGDTFHVRTQVTGVSPTTVRTKVWEVGTPEPAQWLLSATDDTPGLQTAGGVGLRAELGTNSTNAPVRASFDEVWAGPTG